MLCRRRVLVLVIACLPGLLMGAQSASAWETPTGNPTLVAGIQPFADPAASGSGGTATQLYATAYPGTYNIPTENWVAAGGAQTNGAQEALPSLPYQVRAGNTWAPTVAFIRQWPSSGESMSCGSSES